MRKIYAPIAVLVAAVMGLSGCHGSSGTKTVDPGLQRRIDDIIQGIK